jgi:N utilization substance protein B
VQYIYSALMNAVQIQDLVLAALADEHLRHADRSYLQTLIHGALEQQLPLEADLDAQLDRPLVQLDSMERAILLVGGYELLHERTLPARVVINEAVELAKIFGATDGHKYVNGVLDRWARRVRADEYAG